MSRIKMHKGIAITAKATPFLNCQPCLSASWAVNLTAKTQKLNPRTMLYKEVVPSLGLVASNGTPSAKASDKTIKIFQLDDSLFTQGTYLGGP